MSTIIKGHGVDPDGEDTFLPQGVTVRMYSAENVNLDTDVALLALLDDAGDPGVPITGTIKNYLLAKQDDRFIAQWYALAGDSNVPIWWVGTDIPDGTRLCEDPNRNSDDPEAMTCRAQGVHICSGALGLVQDTDIAIVACRGTWVPNQPKGGHVATAYDTTVRGIDALVAEYLTKLSSGDEAQVRQVEDDADHIPQEQLALMIVTTRFAAWQEARWLKEYAKRNDLASFFPQLETSKPRLTQIMKWLNDIPSYGAAVDNVATSYPDTFALWLNKASQEVQKALRTRPAIDTIAQQQADPYTDTMRKPLDNAAVRKRNVEALAAIVADTEPGPARTVQVMQGGGLVLLGDGHDFAAIRSLGKDGKSGTVTFVYNRFSANELQIAGPVDKAAVGAELRALLNDGSLTYEYRDRSSVVIG